jgi:hypothetical protein
VPMVLHRSIFSNVDLEITPIHPAHSDFTLPQLPVITKYEVMKKR